MARDPNAKNGLENSTGKGWSPPSGKWNPPAAGAHAPKDIHRIKGDQGGPQYVHPVLKKPK